MGHWQLEVFAPNRAGAQPPQRFDLVLLRLSVEFGPAWRFTALGDWFSLAGIVLVPALIFEVRSRRKRRAAGFPVEPKKNPAHADGVNTLAFLIRSIDSTPAQAQARRQQQRDRPGLGHGVERHRARSVRCCERRTDESDKQKMWRIRQGEQ
jgi:hypothetical protein